MGEVKATNIDVDGKKRKLKGLVPGKCNFPFKYRRKMVYTCQPRKDGSWCATSVNNDNKTETWGYCTSPKKIKKCSPKKILNPKTVDA